MKPLLLQDYDYRMRQEIHASIVLHILFWIAPVVFMFGMLDRNIGVLQPEGIGLIQYSIGTWGWFISTIAFMGFVSNAIRHRRARIDQLEIIVLHMQRSEPN